MDEDERDAPEGDLDLELSNVDLELSVRCIKGDAPVEALDSTPVEEEIFREHTRWPGLFFRTWRMERVFLDGYARLHKNLVYFGYGLVIVVSVLVPLQWFLARLYRYNSPCPEKYEITLCKPNGEQT